MDALLVAHEHHKAVEAGGDSSVGRRAVLERRHKEAERLLRSLPAVARDLENPLLQGGVVDTHRAASELVAVEHKVVEVALHAARVALKRGPVFFLREGEHMVLRLPVALVLVPCEVGEVDYPCEVEFVIRIVEAQVFAELLADCAESRARRLPFLVAHEEKQVVFLRSEPFAYLRLLSREEF